MIKQYSLVVDTPQSIFRAYDIRGIVPSEINENIAYTLGLVLGTLAKEAGQSSFSIGRDHRTSSSGLCQALCQGLLESGMNVINVGQVATPELYFANIFLKTQSAVMITGSHCAPDYNGFKIIVANKSLADEEIQVIRKMMIEKAGKRAELKGHYQEKIITSDYLAAILARIPPLTETKKIVVDAGHGMMSVLAPQLLKALHCDVIPLYCDIDAHFPHHHPDPSQPENLQDLIKTVIAQKADLGLAFDGDGDRIGVVTSEGKIIWPDRLLAAYAQEALSLSPQGTIIYDVKCTRHLKSFIEACHGKPLMWKTGHSHIKNKMKEINALVAGEMSGHIFFCQDWYGFDDALFAAARLVSLLSKQDKTSHAFFEQIPDSLNTPELKLPMPENEKFSFMESFIQKSHFSSNEKIMLDGLRVEYVDGFGLLRASNTSPYLILRFEADTSVALARIQEEFKRNLLMISPGLKLPF